MAKKKFYVDQDLQGNKILNGGFEVVASLPTANNFVGRQVTHQGRSFIWNGSAWKNDSDTLDGKHYSDIQSDIQNAKTENFGYRYTYDLIMYGDHDKYYPFVIAGGDQNVKRDILIKRSYSELHPAEWFSSTHGGGLTLKIKTNFGDWGGANYGWEIHELEQMYNETFAGAEMTTSYMTFSIFLRGGGTGGAIYHVYSNQPIETNFPLHIDGQGTSGNFPMVFYNGETVRYSTSQYTWAMPSYRATPSTEEIRIRRFIKLAQDNDTRITEIEAHSYIERYNSKVDTNSDWDSFTDIGTYPVGSNVPFTGNGAPPPTYLYGVLVVEKNSTYGIVQTYYPHVLSSGYSSIYMRTGWNSGEDWQPWFKLWNSSNFDPATKADLTSLNGTQNYLTKYGATGITSSNIYDGTNVGIGIETPSEKLDVNGSIKANGYKVGGGTDTKLLTDGGGTKLITAFATSTQGAKADTALQSIDKTMVENVLIGIITSHQHNYTTSTDVSNLINTAIASVYKPKGNIANKAALLALTNIKQGDVYNAQLAFTLNGQNVKAGDNIVCLADAATSTETNWDNLGGNIDFAAALSQALIGFGATSGDITSSDTILSAINKLAYDKHIHSNSTALNAVSGTNTGDENTTRIGRLIRDATEKTTPVDADMVGLMDSAASNVMKKLSWAKIKTTLKAYFDTMYAQLSFSKIKVGGVDIAASANDDIIEFIAGTNVTLTPDAGGKKLTIAASDSQSQIDSLVNTVNSKQDKLSILTDINIASNGSENITPGDNQIQYINLSGATTIHTINLNYYRNSIEEYTMIIVNPNAASRITLNTHASYKFVGVPPSWSYNSWVICIWRGMIFANILN